MQEIVYRLNDGTEVMQLAILPTKHATSKSCKIPMCMSCELSKIGTSSPTVNISKIVKEKEGILSRDYYELVDVIVSDQFNLHTAGRKLDGYGRESSDSGYRTGTVYVDAASGLLQVEVQVSM